MVAGAIGPRGVNVTSPVVKARNSEIAPAPTHPPKATEASVKENLSRARRVKWSRAQVWTKALPVRRQIFNK